MNKVIIGVGLAIFLIASLTSNNSEIKINKINKINNNVELTFNSDLNGVFKFEESNNLLDWKSSTPAFIIKSNSTYTVTINSTNSSKFFRVFLITSIPFS